MDADAIRSAAAAKALKMNAAQNQARLAQSVSSAHSQTPPSSHAPSQPQPSQHHLNPPLLPILTLLHLNRVLPRRRRTRFSLRFVHHRLSSRMKRNKNREEEEGGKGAQDKLVRTFFLLAFRLVSMDRYPLRPCRWRWASSVVYGWWRRFSCICGSSG